MKKEERKRINKDLDRIAERRRSGNTGGNIVRRQESILSSDSYLPAGDIQRTINSVQDAFNNYEARFLKRPVVGSKIFHGQRANYGASNGVNVEIGNAYSYPANNNLVNLRRNRVSSVSSQGNLGAVPRRRLQAQVHANPTVSPQGSFTNLAINRHSQLNPGVAMEVPRNQQAPYAGLHDSQSGLAINCNYNPVEAMGLEMKEIPIASVEI